MRSNERTYTQAIGNLDPDKKDSLHNQACQYLADPKFFPRIAEVVDLKEFISDSNRARLSEPLWKTYKSYNGPSSPSLFGFADLVIGYVTETIIQDYSTKKDVTYHYKKSILVEVKSNKSEILDCIQQLKAYAIYTKDLTKILLVTLYPITKQDKDILLSSSIYHVYLQPEKVKGYFSAHEIDNSSF